MKEQMLYWCDDRLVLTPNRGYGKMTKRILAIGILFLLLASYLKIRVGEFWQLPFALGLCLSIPSLIYLEMVVAQRISIPIDDGAIVFQMGRLYRTKIWQKNEVELVRNSINQRVFIAIAHKNNPYGKAFQISPYLTNLKIETCFEQEVYPIVDQLLRKETL